MIVLQDGRKICSFREEAEFIRIASSEGGTGTMKCPVCSRTLQLGVKRCPHSVMIGLHCDLCQSVGIDSPLNRNIFRNRKTEEEIQKILKEKAEEDFVVKTSSVDLADEPAEIELELETDEEIEYEET